MAINPSAFKGEWITGYSLDKQILKSTFLGEDQHGHPRFDNERTEVGELIYKLKYQNDQSALPQLVAIAHEFLKGWKPNADLIVPMPSSTFRKIQPVFQLANGLAEVLGIPCVTNAVVRVKELPALKNVSNHEKPGLLEGVHKADPEQVEGQRILLVDDLYDSGATMNAVAESLHESGAKKIYGLTFTRSKG